MTMIHRMDPSSCSWSRRVKEYIGEIARETILHGVRYIALPIPNRHGCERVFWGIVVLINLGFSIYIVEHFLLKFWNSPVITTFESQETSISRIPFPAITLCNLNIMKRSTMWEAKLKVDALLKTQKSKDKMELKSRVMVLEYMAHSCLDAKSFRRLINDTLFDARGNVDFVNKMKEELDDLEERWNQQYPGLEQHYAAESAAGLIHQFVHQSAHNCSDMLQRCMLGEKLTPCKKLFSHVHTAHGVCCTFNMMPVSVNAIRSSNERERKLKMRNSNLSDREISEWERFGKGDLIRKPREGPRREHPYYQSSGGQQDGLSLLINPELDVYSTCTSNDGFGFKLIPHSPLSWPRVRDFGIGIPIGSEVFVNVEPIVTVGNEENLQHVDVVCAMVRGNSKKAPSD